MQTGFRRHLVGTTHRNVCYSDDTYDTFSASEVTTLWRYTNLFIIIIIIRPIRFVGRLMIMWTFSSTK